MNFSYDYFDAIANHTVANGNDSQSSSEIGSNSLHAVVTFIMLGVLLNSISVVGIFANLLSVIIMMKPHMRVSSFNRYLAELATFDIVYLVNSAIIYGFPAISDWFQAQVFPRIIRYCYGLAHLGRVGSVFLTASVTIERYFAIVHPFRQFRCKNTLLILAPVLAMAYNVPRFFELQYDAERNQPDYTEMRLNPTYITLYMFWAKFLVIELVPYILILALNILIVRAVRASKKFQQESNAAQGGRPGCISITMRQATVTGSPDASSEQQVTNSNRLKEINMATILVGISFLFILCQSVKIVPDIYEVLACLGQRQESGFCQVHPAIDFTVELSHVLLAINSSCNFFIYAARGSKFRDEVFKLFRCRPELASGPHRPDTDTLKPNTSFKLRPEHQTSKL